MTYPELMYHDGTAHCPVEGCGWSAPEGKEMDWLDHRDNYHNEQFN